MREGSEDGENKNCDFVSIVNLVLPSIILPFQMIRLCFVFSGLWPWFLADSALGCFSIHSCSLGNTTGFCQGFRPHPSSDDLSISTSISSQAFSSEFETLVSSFQAGVCLPIDV